MGWSYIAICLFDFMIAPIGWTALQAFMALPITQWAPITLSNAGLYHIAMGSVLGITAWSRGQEKMKLFDIAKEEDTKE